MATDNKAALARFRAEVAAELTGHIIPFWRGMRDTERGGFYGLLGYDLRLDKDAVKGCILNSRILWFFSNAYKALGQGGLLDCARHAYRFMAEHCFDTEHGGVYWSVNADGTAADTTKHTYNQAFAIYALTSYYEASHDAEALSRAQELFSLIETRCTDRVGYCEAFTRDFRPESNEKLSENGVMAEKTMNTLLHVFEAYTDLYRVTGDARVRERLHFILGQFAEKIWNPALRRQEVFFDAGLSTILDLHSYGHDIETSWLLDKCLDVLGEREWSERVRPLSDAMAEQILAVAYRDSSMLNECDRGVVNTTRVWWVQAESVVGFLNAWQRTGRQEYLDAALSVWGYIRECLVDKRPGSEWYWSLDENRVPDGKPIVEPWKCPYHNGRMCLEVMARAAQGAE